MIISRAPYRISFVGGGTDLKSFYSSSYGMTISTSINKFIYIVVKKPSGYIEKKYKINMGDVQHTNYLNKIKHPIVRETLKLLKINFPIEIGMYADMPSRSGLGSSSSFTVALIKAIYELKKKKISKYKIAEIAAKIEIDILKRSIGKQDHYASAFGSLNLIKYNKNEKVFVNRLNLSDNKQKKIDDNLILFFTGIRRDSNDILNYQNQNVENVKDILIKIRDLVLPFRKLIKGNNIDEIGNILTQSWKLKKSLSNKISSSKINKYFNIALSNGALGGKILGAGGGGFLLFYVRKNKKKQLINSLKNLTQINFNFENDGVKIVYNDKLDY